MAAALSRPYIYGFDRSFRRAWAPHAAGAPSQQSRCDADTSDWKCSRVVNRECTTTENAEMRLAAACIGERPRGDCQGRHQRGTSNTTGRPHPSQCTLRSPVFRQRAAGKEAVDRQARAIRPAGFLDEHDPRRQHLGTGALVPRHVAFHAERGRWESTFPPLGS